jgi:cellulose synthase/poly-beta-1,6-N-acetylglucosamine synthase-like glycosyltransferase
VEAALDMESYWLSIYLLLAGLAIAQGLLVVAQTWEHRRFVRHRVRKLGRYPSSGRVMLLIPCRGMDLELQKNLDTLFQQDHDDYQIRFVVESDADPAYPAIQQIRSRHPQIDCDIVIAGLAPSGGQKVHNLRMATAEIPPKVKYLAFADSDARLRPQWLRAILARLDRQDIAVATGYRWFVPACGTLANLLLHSINANYTFFFGPRTPGFIWGGSWAIRRELFEALQIRHAWQDTLSDDLVATRIVRRSRFRAIFEPVCMVRSPLDMSFRQMFSFLRRQYLIGRYYAPLWWAFAVVMVTFANLVFWWSAGWAVWAGIAGWSRWWIPATAVGLLYLISVLRGWVRSSTARIYFPDLDPTLRQACRFDTWATPLVSLVHGAALLSSMVGRHLVWRGITYRLLPGGRSELLWREPANAEDQASRPVSASGVCGKPHLGGAAGRTASVAEPRTGSRTSV